MNAGSKAFRSQLAQRRGQAILQTVQAISILPTSVTVPMKLLQLQRGPVAGMSEFATVISADPALASKVLGLANSAAFAPSRPITKLPEAISLIGLKNLLSLTLGISLGGIFNKLGLTAVESRALWRAALLKAVAARQCAQLIAPDQVDEAFLFGLFQDIGLSALYAADRSAWAEVCAILDLLPEDRLERELDMNGVDHSRIGAVVGEQLALPKCFREVIGLHHAGREALEEAVGLELGACVECASVFPHRLSNFAPQVVSRLAPQIARATRGTDIAALGGGSLPQMIVDDYMKVLTSLGDSEISTATFNQFVAALSAEVALSLESSIEESSTVITSLKARESELDGKIRKLEEKVRNSDFDGLTRTLTRTAFMGRSQTFFKLAHEYKTPCAIGFADLDDLKQINDKYGHAAGDAALVLIAQRLALNLKENTILARMGGDEFAFLAVARSPEHNISQADKLSEAMSNLELQLPQGKITISASIGVVWLGVPKANPTLDEMLKQADYLMYQAKKQGKGRCLTSDGGRAGVGGV